MKITTVRFGEDLWQLLEHESELLGISVSQYIREAALARAVAAAAERGSGPFDVLARAARETVGPEDTLQRREAERALAALARAMARSEVEDSQALKAQGRQAVRRARELAADKRRQR